VAVRMVGDRGQQDQALAQSPHRRAN
jgi:hypothetical protein